MTDRELAEAYVTKNARHILDTNNAFKSSHEAFIAGLKSGRPQWHDLRKNPNDLPQEYTIIRKAFGIYSEEKSYHRVLNQDGCFVHRLGSNWYYIYEEDADGESLEANVTAWKEIILPDMND